MMKRPPEITKEEWEFFTSPEVYYMDGEVSPEEADRIFHQRIKNLIEQRRKER